MLCDKLACAISWDVLSLCDKLGCAISLSKLITCERCEVDAIRRSAWLFIKIQGLRIQKKDYYLELFQFQNTRSTSYVLF